MSVMIFRDNEMGFREWRDQNPDGYVLNTTRNPSPAYLILHRATCRTISGDPTRGKYWTRDYIKVCAANRKELESWADREVGAKPRACMLCNPC